jgi:hypothetical protein
MTWLVKVARASLLYRRLDARVPKFIWARSPKEAWDRSARERCARVRCAGYMKRTVSSSIRLIEHYGFARYIQDAECNELHKATVAGKPTRLFADGGRIDGSTNYGADLFIVEVTRPEGATYLPAMLDHDDRPWKPTCKNALSHLVDFQWDTDGYIA